jgi:pimeloyl-ACP methyl ester carboxylesterase
LATTPAEPSARCSPCATRACVEEYFVGPVLHDKGVRRDIAGFLKAANKKQLVATAEHYSEIDVPVLLAWGEDDKSFKLALAERMARDISNARLERIPDSYTFVSLDQPERLAALISR